METTRASQARWFSGDFATPAIHKVTADETGRWLAAGWRDLRRSPALSLGYGLSFVAFGYLLLVGLEQVGLGSLFLPLLGGFMLVAPVLAVGLYEISRRLELGDRPDIRTLLAFRRNGEQIGMMGVALLILTLVWIQLAFLLFALFFSASPPPMESFLLSILTSTGNLPFLLIGTAIGGFFAALAFTISVVSIPMLLDRDATVVTAIATSIQAVLQNWRVMIGWAAMIVLIIGAGMATLFIGLAIALPLVAHASWHAYRGLVGQD
ncbi:DUF2189 domain-containing protein [Telmatospirillum sp. J64-1]|uniref:DUF2189 domain-containing protein n=1 Tax=Telmatospirillum sp. J64-1 TaxID=2502183 RepID=UPI00115DB4B5|nr:DUF2189 domain-containing protein [Telmatospirillum sp. J64-1]